MKNYYENYHYHDLATKRQTGRNRGREYASLLRLWAGSPLEPELKNPLSWLNVNAEENMGAMTVMVSRNHLLSASLVCLVAFVSGIAQGNELTLGQCRKDLGPSGLPPGVAAITTGFFVDITTEPIEVPARGPDNPSGEVTILKDFVFDEAGINHVVAIQQIYDVDCGRCPDLANNARPWECTNGVTDVLLHAYESKANFNPATRIFPLVFGDARERSFISVVMHPGDNGFAYRTESGPLQHANLKLGRNGGSRLTVGTVAARIILSDQPRTIGPITMRFHVLHEASRASDLNTAFLIAANFVDPQPDFLEFSEDLQTRVVRLSEANVRFLIQVVNEESKIRFVHLGVVGHHWQTGSRLEVVRKNGKVETVRVNDKYNFYGTPLPMSDLVLRAGDEVRFTCEYANTANPTIESLLGNSPIIPIGPLISQEPCAIQAIYGKAECDAQFVSTFKDGNELLAFDCNSESKQN